MEDSEGAALYPHLCLARGASRRRGVSLIVGVCVVLLGASAYAKPARRQSNWGKDDGAGNVVCNWNKAIASGSLLIATVTYTGGTGTTFTVPTSLSGQAWTEISSGRSDNTSNIGVRMFYIQNSTAHAIGNEPSWTVSPTSAEVVLQLHEFSGVELSNALDADGVNNGTTVSTPTTGVVTANSLADETSELSFAVFGVQNAASTLGTPTPGFSNITSVGTSPLANSATPTTTNTKTRDAFVLLTSAGSGNAASMTMTTTGLHWAAAIATFKVKSIYWIGMGGYPARPAMAPDPTVCYGYFDDEGCWSTTSGGVNNVSSPGANDVVIFDGAGPGDVTFNPFSAGTESAYSIESDAINPYPGTASVTNNAFVPDLQTTARFTWGSGTFTVNDAQVTFGTGATAAQRLAITGGTFNAGTGTVSVGGVTYMNGTGTFNGATATETFSQALQVTAGTMYLGTASLNAGAATIGATGTVTTAGVGLTFPTSLTITGGTFNVGSGGVSITTLLAIPGGTFNAGTGSVTVNTTTALTAGGTFNGNAAAVTLTGNVTVGATAGVLGTFNGSSNTTTLGGTLVVRGTTATPAYSTFSAGGGTTTVTGNTTIDQSAIFNANTGTVNFTGTVTVGATTPTPGTFNANSAIVSFNNAAVSGANSLLVRGGSAFNGGTAQLTFGKNAASGSNAINLSSGTMDLSSASTTFNPSPGSGNVTIAASTTLTLGSAAATFPATVTVTGTLTDGNGARTFSGPLAVSGTYTAGAGAHTFSVGATNSAGTMNLAGAASLTFSSGTLTVSGGTTTFGSQTVSVPALAVSAGGTFNAGTSNLTVSGATTIATAASNLTLSSAASLTFSGALTQTNGTTTFGSQTVTLPALSVAAGTFNAGTSTLTVTTTTTVTGGAVNLGSTTSGPTFTGAVSISGGTLTLGSGTAAIQTTLTVTGGSFFAGASHLTITGATAINGDSGAAGTFDGGTSTVTFSGAVTVGGTPGGGSTRGIFHAKTATISFEFPTTLMAPDSLLLQGASNTLFDVATTGPTYASITFGKNAIAGTNAVNLQAGTMDVNSSSTPTFNPVGGAGNVTIASGTTLTMGASAAIFPQTVTVAGTFAAGSGGLAFSGPLTVSGTFTGSSGGLTFSGAVSVSGTMSGGAGTRTFSSTLTVSGAYTCSTVGETFNGAVTNSAGTMNLATSAPTLSFGVASSLTVSGGTTTFGTQTVTVQSLSVSSGAFDAGTSRLTVAGTTNVTGGTATLSSTRPIILTGAVTINAGTLTLGTSTSTVTVTGATTVTGAGIFTAGSSTALAFNGGLTLGTVAPGSPGTFNGGTATTTMAGTTIQGGSTFNVGAATSITFNTAFSLLGSSAWNGMTGTTTFSVAPTLTSGTFSVGSAATAGRHTFNQSTTFSSGVTLSFPSDKGELRLANTKILTLDGPVTSDVGTASTLPKIDCNGCAAGITVAFGATSTLNINGLEFDNSVAAGVSIASGATYTLLKRLKFQSNLANSILTGATHLAITSANAILVIPGCIFDATAQYNVTLSGTMASTGVRAIFEDQGSNGARAGESFDLDADTDEDNVANSSMANRWGSVVEWVAASPADTAGTAVGFPTAAFDWNTFTFYGVYVAYQNIAGAGTADRLWLRNTDGTAAYFYDVPEASGDIVGTPKWDSVNETTAGLDVNGDGDSTDTSVHVVYIGTSLGHIIKLIDNGTSLARPAAGVWSTDFSDASTVLTISSALIADSTNLYFGGTDASSATKIFGVQITAGGSEKTVVKNIGSVGAITTAPSWAVYGGKTYLFLGSVASMSQAYVYRVEVSPGALVQASYSGPTTSVNGSVNLVNNRAYAATDGGNVYALDAANFGVGGFANMPGTSYPYNSAAASPIKSSPYIDPFADYAYFGDNTGKLYVLDGTGANFAGYPYALTGGAALSSSPIYITGSGVIAVGAADGYVYFVDRHNASNLPALIKKYFAGTGTVSSVGWNASTSQYMVSTSDGKLSYINASTVPDPTGNI
jgi:fibronectin-binding autotransporter adhesin